MAIGRIPEPGTGIPESIVDAKGDIVTATAADTPARLAVGTTEHRLVAASGEATGLKYVADTTNYAVAAKGDLLVGTAADTLAALTVGANGTTLVADSSEATGLKWAAAASGGGLVFITRTTYSGVSSVSVNNCFTATYKNYVTYTQFTATTGTSDVFIRMRASGSDSTTASYNVGFAGTDRGNTAQKYAQSDSTNGYKVSSYETTETVQNIAIKVDFMSPTTNTRQQILFQNTNMDASGTFIYGAGAGSRTSSFVADGFTIRSTAGTFTGYTDIYGLANA
jgi:hypothetical protein